MTSSIWEDIAATADQLLARLSPLVPATSHSTSHQKPTALPLCLPNVDSQSLHQALSKRPISNSLIETVLQHFISRKDKLYECYWSHWRVLFASPEALHNESLQLLKEASQKKYVDDVEELKKSILNAIDERLEAFKIDAEASSQSELESSSEDGMHIPRGHSRLAVKILEKAYSRTTNISRAEKLRLAAAAKLEPRQVTIWFQNRRNRKVTAVSQPELESRSSTVTPTAPSVVSKKRKAGGIYHGEIRQPSQRLRTSTTENQSSRHIFLTSTSSTSSMTSSIDSLASFCRGRNGKDRNYSTDSSEIETMDSSYSTKGPVTGLTSFDDQIDRMAHRLPSIVVKNEEEEASSSLLFSDTGMTQLDFDDLGLDLNSLVDELPSFDLGDYDFAVRTPSTSSPNGNQLVTSYSDVDKTPKRPTFAVPEVPTSMFEAATSLNGFFVDAEEELKRAQQIEEWAFGMGSLLEESQGEDDELYLNLQGLRSGGKNSPSSDYTSTNGCNSQIATPPDLFDFSFEGLHLDHIMNDCLESYHGLNVDIVNPAKQAQDLSIDVRIANDCSLDEDLATARDVRQEIMAG